MLSDGSNRVETTLLRGGPGTVQIPPLPRKSIVRPLDPRLRIRIGDPTGMLNADGTLNAMGKKYDELR